MAADCAVALDPFDTVAFREPRPFQQDDLGLSEMVGLFPPYPPTLAGAALVALAGAPSLDRGEKWQDIADRLARSADPADNERATLLRRLASDGPDGPRMIGPLLAKIELRATLREAELCVPCPATFRVPSKPSEGTHVKELHPKPIPKVRRGCDEAGRPIEWEMESADKRYEPVRDRWIAWHDLRRVLADPDYELEALRLVGPEQILGHERRVALALDPVSGTAIETQLYATDQRRLLTSRVAGRSTRFVPAMIVQGFANKPDGTVIVPCGGEGRFAASAILDLSFTPHVPANNAKEGGDGWLNYRIVALTPVAVDPVRPFGIVSPFDPNPENPSHRIVAAVADRPHVIGFFNSRQPRERRSRIVNAFPAGSTWFVRAQVGKSNGQKKFADWAKAAASGLDGQSPVWLGPHDLRSELSRLGFGGFAIGFWK